MADSANEGCAKCTCKKCTWLAVLFGVILVLLIVLIAILSILYVQQYEEVFKPAIAWLGHKKIPALVPLPEVKPPVASEVKV